MYSQPIITPVAEAESTAVGAQRKSGFARRMPPPRLHRSAGTAAGPGGRRRGSEAWPKGASLLVRLQHGGGPVPARWEKQAWPSPWPRAGARSTLKETKMDHVALRLRIFPAYMGYNPGTFLWFRRPSNSRLLSSPPLFMTTLYPG